MRALLRTTGVAAAVTAVLLAGAAAPVPAAPDRSQTAGRDAPPALEPAPVETVGARTRRASGLVRVRVRGGAVTRLSIRAVGAPGLSLAHFGRRGAVERRLSALRLERTVRVWLNGRRVTRELDASHPARWTARLSADHGLRHGVNRLRIRVIEQDRYEVLRRRFVVRPSRHLPAAGRDVGAHVGARVRLDGRRSRTADGGRVRHRWRIIAKPSGSRAELRRAGSARPTLTPDRRGRYVVGLTVTSRDRDRRAGRAVAAQTASARMDTMMVTATPTSLVIPFEGATIRGRATGIQVGDAFYANPSPNGASMQWLTLDRSTLTPTSDHGNGWLSDGWDGPNGLNTLASALTAGAPGSLGKEQLVVLAFPGGGSAPPVQADQVGRFNQLMVTLGVDPIDAGVLQGRGRLAIVGIPFAGYGSGWSTHDGAGDALTGSLMPDVALDTSGNFRYRLHPERPAFDTSSRSTPLSNTMTIRDREVTVSVGNGVTGAFHVVQIDPVDFTVVRSDVFGTGGAWDGLGILLPRLAEILAAGDLVAVQSFGNPTTVSSTWPLVASALAPFGANPHTFNAPSFGTGDGPPRLSYAFIGGAQLDRTEVAESSTTIVTDPTTSPATREAGTLNGRMSMRGDGTFAPVGANALGSYDSKFHDIVFRASTPWPYTSGGRFPQQTGCPAAGDDAAAYASALAYVGSALGFPNLRAAYVTRDLTETWSDQKTDLELIPFVAGRGFDAAELCNLKAQLQTEFDWLDRVRGLFDAYQDALTRSGQLNYVDLQRIGTRILGLVAPDSGEDGSVVLWSVGSFLGNMGSAGILGMNPDATGALAAWEALVTGYELVRDLVSDDSGAPLGNAVASTAQTLSGDVASRLFDAANGLDRLRQVIISDHGRLSALGPVADGTGWKVDPGDTATRLTAGANAFFGASLLPVASSVWYLRQGDPTNRSPVTTDNCWLAGYGWPFRGASAQLPFDGDFPGAIATEDRHLWVLASPRGPNDRTYPPSITLPSGELTGSMFRAPSQGGYGIPLERYLWQRYSQPPAPAYCGW